jgi:1,4-alpha-glucan branching enzyme
VSVLRSGETDFFDWTFELNAAIVAYLVRWKELGGRIDLLHAHDWLVLQAARELKASYGVPLVATIHATESGRNRGSLHSELSHRIHGLEWELTYEAARVFVCSEFMREEVIRLFSLPRDKTAVFPNGVKVAADAPAVARPDERLEWAAPGEKIVLFIGRLVYEKGVQTLLAAMPRILERVPEAKLIIAGSGPMEAEARAIAAPLGGKVAFAGFADAKLKETLYGVADVVVVPSLYEPFGIVALEAMCRGKPLVVSDTGGLADIIEHGVDGYKALPGHVESLAWHTSELLLHSDAAARMIAAATAKLRKKYDCAHIAACIADVYRDLLQLDMPAEGSDFAQVSSSMAAAGI